MNSAALVCGFRGQGEAWFGCGFAHEQACGVFADGGSVLETVTGTTADKIDIGKLGMTVDEEIAVRCIFVLTDTGFQDQRIRESRKASRYESARPFGGCRRDQTRLCIGINPFAVRIAGQLEAAPFEVRHTVNFIGWKKPGGKGRRGETGIARRSGEEEDLLARWEDARGEQLRKNFAEPGTAGEYKAASRNAVTISGVGGFNSIGAGWSLDLRGAEVHAEALSVFDSAGNSAAGEQNTAIGLEETPGNAVEIKLRIKLVQLRRLEYVVSHSAAAQRRNRVIESGVAG